MIVSVLASACREHRATLSAMLESAGSAEKVVTPRSRLLSTRESRISSVGRVRETILMGRARTTTVLPVSSVTLSARPAAAGPPSTRCTGE